MNHRLRKGVRLDGVAAVSSSTRKLAQFPIMKSILSVVPAPPKENSQSGKDLRRALPIEFVELSRTESYGY